MVLASFIDGLGIIYQVKKCIVICASGAIFDKDADILHFDQEGEDVCQDLGHFGHLSPLAQ